MRFSSASGAHRENRVPDDRVLGKLQQPRGTAGSVFRTGHAVRKSIPGGGRAVGRARRRIRARTHALPARGGNPRKNGGGRPRRRAPADRNRDFSGGRVARTVSVTAASRRWRWINVILYYGDAIAANCTRGRLLDGRPRTLTVGYSRRVSRSVRRCTYIRAGPYEYNDPIIKFNRRPGALAGVCDRRGWRGADRDAQGWGTPSDGRCTPGGSDWSETDAHARVAYTAVFSVDPIGRLRRMTLSFFSAGDSLKAAAVTRTTIIPSTRRRFSLRYRVFPTSSYHSFCLPRNRIIHTNGAR